MNRARRAPQAVIVDDDAQRSLRLRSHAVLAALDAVAVRWSAEVVPLVELLQPRVLIAAHSPRYVPALREICERAQNSTVLVIQQNGTDVFPHAARTVSEAEVGALVERMAHVPRVAEGDTRPSLLRLGNTIVDVVRGHVIRDNHTVSLAPCEHAVLAALVRRAGECVSRETLLEEVWKGKTTSSRVVDRQVFLLRKRIEENPRRPRYIVTAFDRGYKLVRD